MSKKDVGHHIGRLESTATHLDRLVADAGPDPSFDDIALMARYLSDIYFSIEEVMTCLATAAGVPVPGGPRSHADLLGMFRDPPSSGLPILIPGPIAEHARQLMKFRHFCNHNYTVDLDWRHLQSHLANYRQIVEAFRRAAFDHLGEGVPDCPDSADD